ncbi:MAG TPA: hypothetical protein VEH07_08815, partial [Alphaproteobacteria bacterium]|nr:hypothetical protein [Alphaproteobacteria bacterium]
AVTALIPAMLSSASPDPGAHFSFFCAYAAAMRRTAKVRQVVPGDMQTDLPAPNFLRASRPRPRHGV